MKVCSKCKQLKTAFYENRAECKDCTKLRMKAYSQNRYATTSEKIKAHIAQVSLKTKSTYVYHSILRSKYGLEPEDYSRMLEDQNGVCWICKAVPTKRRLAVDHCHKTGKIRGLLCWHCNYRLLPAARDNPEILKRAADYLTK